MNSISNDNQGDSKSNVIDMTDRVQTPDYRERLRGLKVRFDLEHAKVAVSTSLLSIVILVTLANNNLMTSISPTNEVAANEQSAPGGRSIASVSGGGSSTASLNENPALIQQLANRDLSPSASLGHLPSSVERLAFGVLEGKYAVRLQDGLIREIEFSGETGAQNARQEAKRIGNTASFIDGQKDLLPEYSHSVKVGDGREGVNEVETFQLVNQVSMPVAKVQVRMDGEGRLLGMKVSKIQIASK